MNNQICFSIVRVSFSEEEKSSIEKIPKNFLNKKYKEINEDKTNSTIYIPNIDVNLKGNFLWYSKGLPNKSVMVFSSFLFEKIITDSLDFGEYIILLYCQFLARYAVDIEETHRNSKNCLNDFCANQIEILNVFKNKSEFLCNECLKKIRDEPLHDIIKNLFSFIIVDNSKKIAENNDLEESREKLKIDSSIEIDVFDKNENHKKLYWYEFEIYMAKKCANISSLYEKLDEILRYPDSSIDGYSLYEVGGGWRGDIFLKHAIENDWETLYSLQEKYGDNDFKDVIRPLIKCKEKKYAVYDEASIVLRIIINSDEEIKEITEEKCKHIKEIKEIFEEITEKEKSVFFTFNKINKVGNIVRRENVI